MPAVLEAAQAAANAVVAQLQENYPDFRLDGNDNVSGKVSGEFRLTALYSLLAAMAAIALYIWIRFEWQFGVGALFALFHDVSLTLGMFALFQMEFSLQIIAAILAIIGYSLNDTIVVYDRIRENLKKFRKMPLPELLDLSVNETLARTVMTSLTLLVALIPLLRLHNEIGIGKGYLGIWLAHTGFGLPLAIYLLRNYMVGLPREVIESARVDGATEFQIFRRIILPLSFPALASFAIFQFLWVWNDLLVATVFLGNTREQLVMTGVLRELMGSKGGEWEILATSAFISIAVPLVVFFAMQKYLVRGLLAGSVKGG